MGFGSPQLTTSASGKPPERGSFPLDRKGECKQAMKDLLACLKQNQQRHEKCREWSKHYLECRMKTGLMDKDDFKNLGFVTGDEKEDTSSLAGESKQSRENK
jgi:cytochrome c oxidase assembly protein subunit 19